MADPTRAAARSMLPPTQFAPWQDVMAYIDAMPGVPAWKEIEAAVVERVRPEMDARFAGRTSGYNEPHDDRMFARERWLHYLARLYPRAYNVIRGTSAGMDDILYKSLHTWLLAIWFADDAPLHLDTIADAWRHANGEVHSPYALNWMTTAMAHAILRQLAHLRRVADAYWTRKLAEPHMVRFARDLGELVTRDRTTLALSGLIDRLNLRDANAAQYLARYIAPDAITPARPLRTREHASQVREMRAHLSDMDRADAVLDRATRSSTGGRARVDDDDDTGRAATTNRQYLESILAVLRTPGQDPAVTLDRARTMLDTLAQSVDLAPSVPADAPPVTHW